MSRDFDDDTGRPAKKPGMSTGMKVLLVLGILGGLACIACCGGLYWVKSQFKMDFAEDPAKAIEVADEIAEVDLPEGFEGKGAANMTAFSFGMKMAIFEQTGGPGTMMLMQMKVPEGTDVEKEFEKSLRQQSHGPHELENETTRTQEIEVRGKPAKFVFAEGRDPKKGLDMRQVSGVFSAKGGYGMLVIQVKADEFTDEQLEAIVRSIR